MEANVPNLPPELVKLIGRLHFRTSYGQNVLNHSIEVSVLAATIAAELGADVDVCKVAGLLHDLGKAIDQEVEGPHMLISGEIAQALQALAEGGSRHRLAPRHRRRAAVLEAAIVQAADAISAARPGARRETIDLYIKRLEMLESIANSFTGVEKSFAIQAGREVRIIVKPEDVDEVVRHPAGPRCGAQDRGEHGLSRPDQGLRRPRDALGGLCQVIRATSGGDEATNTVDLHTHSTASDGLYPPAELVGLAHEAGLRVIGLIDHDTTDGLEEAIEAGEPSSVSPVIPGIEVNTTLAEHRGDAHVLGYYLQYGDPAFQANLRLLRDARVRRGERMVERLREQGFDHHVGAGARAWARAPSDARISHAR